MNKKVKRFLPLAIFMVLCVFFLRGLFLDPSEMPSALIDKRFPDFQLASLKDTNKTLTRKDVLGKPALVNIWASWCFACKIEHPLFVDLANQGVPIIGINYKDNHDNAIKWLDDLGDPYTFNIVDQRGTLGIDLGVFGAPETYLIDAEGVIRHKHVGVVDLAIWNETLKPMLEQYSQ